MIVAPFDLLQLPKFALSPDTTVPIYSGKDHLFVGVSSSAVNRLSLRPPQVVSAHAVAPGTTISAVTASEPSYLVYGSVYRGKNFLNLIKLENEENDGTKPILTVEVPEEVGALYLSTDNLKIAAISKKTCSITVYDSSTLSEVSSSSQTNTESGELVYTSALSLKSSETSNFVVVSRHEQVLQLQTLALDSRGVYSLMSVNIDGRQTGKEAVADSYFSHANDLLYQAVGSVIYVYKIPDATIITMFELDEAEGVTGIVALPNNNAAIARRNKIDLIDCTFQSYIATIELNGQGSISLLGYFAPASAVIAMQGKYNVIGLSVTPTNGTLLESIGKGSARKLQSFSLADIFEGFNSPASEWKQTAEQQLSKANDEVSTVISALQGYINQRDGISFAEIVTYLKDPKLNWVEWHESGSASGPQQQDLVYEETDRNADRKLIRRVSEMAFLPRFKPYLPIGVAVYLLTHPLFPSGEPQFEKLLRSLERSDNILYRQALVSLTGITAKDLVLGLVSKDNETFLDAAARLQEDYGHQQILQGIREAFGSMSSISSLSVLIERLSRYPETISLMSPFIDAMGMLAWDTQRIDKLQEKISKQIKTTESYIEADAAITELFNAVGLNASQSDIPSSSAELRNTRDQLNPSSGENENCHLPKYSIETLTL